ncbi:MAG TPA: glycoside hydrolase family 13 protein [Anaerolineales bacterium]|nr:glycoside hydrolase family 13 protein [Anaerolineales bacterium]
MAPPGWVRDAIFYQIFPDRFANGDPSNDPPQVQPWGAPPTTRDFQGGDLQGIHDHLDYLSDLGVDAIYLNPIFQAGSNHRYNASDYLRVDDRLGSLEDFRRLLRGAHDRGIRVVLDGVFNHSGRGFFAFQDLLDHGEASPCGHWYHVRSFPLDAFGENGKARNYEAWWGMRNLPKFNTEDPEVRAYLLKVARYWVEQGIDGWRLDVPNEIPDLAFWGEVRDVVTNANPEAVLLGEIWSVSPAWVGPGVFDGLMNYPLRQSLLELAVERTLSPQGFADQVQAQYDAYPEAFRGTHYNLLGSHDTPRVATLAARDGRTVRLLNALLFALPGAPSVYYGDEIGLEGGKDPDCRRAFEWDRSRWDADLRDFIKSLIRLRRSRVELRRGDLRFLPAAGDGSVLAFVRNSGAGTFLLAANMGEGVSSAQLDVSGIGWAGHREVVDSLTGRTTPIADGKLDFELAPLGFLALHDS